MTEFDIFSFMEVCEGFVSSSKELRDAAALCDDDPVKQEMIAFIVPDFNKMWARSEGVRTLLEGKDFSENRNFILEEMKEITRYNLEMAKKIRDKLCSLSWN